MFSKTVSANYYQTTRRASFHIRQKCCCSEYSEKWAGFVNVAKMIKLKIVSISVALFLCFSAFMWAYMSFNVAVPVFTYLFYKHNSCSLHNNVWSSLNVSSNMQTYIIIRPS